MLKPDTIGMVKVATFVYKNISDQDLVIPNVGVVEAGGTIETAQAINNKNLEEVKQSAAKKAKEDKE